MLFSWHHALTDCKHVILPLLLPRIAFPSVAICTTFFPVFIISFALFINKASIIFGSSIVNNHLNVHYDGIFDFKSIYFNNHSFFIITATLSIVGLKLF